MTPSGHAFPSGLRVCPGVTKVSSSSPGCPSWLPGLHIVGQLVKSGLSDWIAHGQYAGMAKHTTQPTPTCCPYALRSDQPDMLIELQYGAPARLARYGPCNHLLAQTVALQHATLNSHLMYSCTTSCFVFSKRPFDRCSHLPSRICLWQDRF